MGKNKKKSVSLTCVTNINEPTDEKTLDTNVEKLLDEIVEKALDNAEEPKGSTEEPKGSTEEPKGSTEEPKGSTEEPKGSTEEPKGSTEEAVKLESVSVADSVELVEISVEKQKETAPEPKKKSDCSKGFCVIL